MFASNSLFFPARRRWFSLFPLYHFYVFAESSAFALNFSSFFSTQRRLQVAGRGRCPAGQDSRWDAGPFPTRHKTLSGCDHISSVTYYIFFYFIFFNMWAQLFKVGCYVTLLISSVSPFFCSSSQQPENGELWRPCENFPGKNQRAKNLHRMPRVSMRTSGESECLGGGVRGGVWKLGLVREATPDVTLCFQTSDSAWREGDDLLMLDGWPSFNIWREDRGDF